MPAPLEHDRTDVAVRAATFAAAAIIAQQVGAKTARDALFLQNFDVDLLPRLLGAAALLAIPTVLLSARMLGRYGPARIVPWAFGASAILQAMLAMLVMVRPGLAAVLFYFHVACFGAVLVSGFWSVINERFDPNTARRRIARIGTGASAGGVIGGILATVAGRELGDPALLLLLAFLHALAAIAVARSTRGARFEHPTPPPGAVAGAMEGLRVIAGQPYLRLLVVLVIAVTAGAACLDFVFKGFAQEHFGRDASAVELVTFFGVFHTALSLLTLLLQGTLVRPLLERFGLARTVATLPASLGLGAVAVLLVPMWPLVAVARACEASVRSSLFRSAYELLYTPLAPREKRAGKAIIDVGGERAGDAMGAVLVQTAVLTLPTTALISRETALLLAAVALAMIALALTRKLHLGYVSTLESSLRRRHVALQDHDLLDHTTRTLVMRRRELSDPAAGDRRVAPPVADRRVRPASDDPLLVAIGELRSGDSRRVIRTLATHTPLAPELIGHVVELLAWDAVAEEAISALRATGTRAGAALIGAVLDRDEEFAIRRRAPRALGGEPDALLVEALLEGLRAERFEIRFQCARALARLVGDRSIPVDPARLLDRVLAEVSVAAGVWDSHRALDVPRRDYLLDPRTSTGRAPVALQHVFTLLSLILPPKTLQLALQGVLSRDAQMRGTALEYLESVLPSAIRDRLWVHLERVPRDFEAAMPAGPDSELLRSALQTQVQEHLSLRASLDAALRQDADPSS